MPVPRFKRKPSDFDYVNNAYEINAAGTNGNFYVISNDGATLTAFAKYN